MKGKRPVLLLFHGGGFAGGTPDSTADAAQAAKRRGFRPVNVNYPTGNLDAAFGAAKHLAKKYGRHGRSVSAYGESAGGVLAGRLAQKGLVRSGVGLVTPTNLTTDVTAPAAQQVIAQNNPTPQQLRRLALAKHRTRNPFLMQIGDQDQLLDTEQQRRWAQRDPRVKATTVHSNHVYPQSPIDRAASLRAAMRYLLRQSR